jgi:hypothetical protein
MADFGANPQLRHLLPYASRVSLPPHVQGLLPAGRLGLCREGVEPSGSLRKVSARLTIILLSCSPDATGFRYRSSGLRRCGVGAAASRRGLVAFRLLTSVRGTRTLLFVSLERIVRSIEVVASLKPAVRSFR